MTPRADIGVTRAASHLSFGPATDLVKKYALQSFSGRVQDVPSGSLSSWDPGPS
jgi:hypothetical protein